jgi:membrane protease YdiL (CAAX protease family)
MPAPVRALRRHPLAVFFALAFGLAWAVLVPMALASRGLTSFEPPIPLLVLTGHGPTFAAVAAAWLADGRAGVGRLLGRFTLWRVGWLPWAVGLLLPGATSLAALGLHALAGGGNPDLPAATPALVATFVVQLLVRGLINGEEAGWRGFALPRLRERHGVTAASLILGLATTLVHLPIVLSVGPSLAGSQSEMSFPLFLVSTVAGSFLFTWLAERAGGSLLLSTALGVAVALAIALGTGRSGRREPASATPEPAAP